MVHFHPLQVVHFHPPHYAHFNPLWVVYYARFLQFITIGDCKQAINTGLEQASTDLKGFQKSVKALEILEQQEKKYKETLLLINDAKRAIFYRYIKKR